MKCEKQDSLTGSNLNQILLEIRQEHCEYLTIKNRFAFVFVKFAENNMNFFQRFLTRSVFSVFLFLEWGYCASRTFNIKLNKGFF